MVRFAVYDRIRTTGRNIHSDDPGLMVLTFTRSDTVILVDKHMNPIIFTQQPDGRWRHSMGVSEGVPHWEYIDENSWMKRDGNWVRLGDRM